LILYKYYGFGSGLSALKSSQLGFRTPKDFNDPFELTYLSNAEGPGAKLSELDHRIEELKKSVSILSLTRTPLNPLMWAHYGEDHSGFVIGYEVEDEFLTSKEYNLVPVDSGDVVYTNTKNSHRLNYASMDLIHKLYLASQGAPLDPDERSNIENLVRKVFLTKHASWVYEEEVRVVKVPYSLFEETGNYQQDPKRHFYGLSKDVAPGYSCTTISGLSIFSYKTKIKEVYLGVRNPLLKMNLNEEYEQNGEYHNDIAEKSETEKWDIFSLSMARESWELEKSPIQNQVLRLKEKDRGLLNSFSFSGSEAEFLKCSLQSLNISEKDNFELTNWNGDSYLKVNGKFKT